MSAVFDSFVMILKMSRTTKAIEMIKEMIKEMIAAVSRSFLLFSIFPSPLHLICIDYKFNKNSESNRWNNEGR